MTSVVTVGLGLALAVTASAEPGDLEPPAPPPDMSAVDPGGLQPPTPPAGLPPADVAPIDPMSGDAGDPAATACSQFAAALDHSSNYYSDYADALADPSMGADWNQSTNVTGRTALRQSAAAALTAAGTPGLSPDIMAPMQSWSLNATKLLVLMGVNAPVDGINGKATDLNTDANNVQMACAAAGTHA